MNCSTFRSIVTVTTPHLLAWMTAWTGGGAVAAVRASGSPGSAAQRRVASKSGSHNKTTDGGYGTRAATGYLALTGRYRQLWPTPAPLLVALGGFGEPAFPGPGCWWRRMTG